MFNWTRKLTNNHYCKSCPTGAKVFIKPLVIWTDKSQNFSNPEDQLVINFTWKAIKNIHSFLEIPLPFQFLSSVSLGVPLGMNSNQDEKYFLQLIFIPHENTQKPSVSELQGISRFPKPARTYFYLIVPKPQKIHESVLHLFCTCSVTRSLWVQSCLWASNANIWLTSDLDPQYCILGMYRENLQDQVIVNHLILLFKRYVYLKKGDKIAPNLTGLKAYIKYIGNLERNIASESKKLDYHYKKWDRLIPFL